MQEKVEKLVTNNLGLVRYVAKQFSSSNVDFDDQLMIYYQKIMMVIHWCYQK